VIVGEDDIKNGYSDNLRSMRRHSSFTHGAADGNKPNDGERKTTGA